jgi:hypothetical protein
LAALVARIDATRPRLVTDALERLRQRRIVEVTGRKGRSMTAATVRLVPPESRIPEQVPTRRSVGDDARWLAPYLRP